MAESSGNDYTIRSAERVCDILEALASASAPLSLNDLAISAEMPKPTAFRYAATLERRGFLSRDENGDWVLGTAILSFHVNSTERIAEKLRPSLVALRDRFEETTNLGQLDGGRIVYLEILESPMSMRLASRIGDRDPIHSTALGKVIAATLSKERLDGLLATHGLPPITNSTIIDHDEFEAELELIRERGYAVDRGENEEGSLCVAVAIPNTQPPMAISLSAPATRVQATDVPTIASALLGMVQGFAGRPDLE